MPAAFGRRCMQIAENSDALRTPLHFAAGFGARQRRSDTGGAAKGTPLKTRTSGAAPATPERRPCSTRTGSVIAALSGSSRLNQRRREMFLFIIWQVAEKPRSDSPFRTTVLGE